MLTCKEQVARSSDYLDGQLTFRERLMVRHHLMFCPNCRRFIRQMRLMQATLKRMPQEPVEVWMRWPTNWWPNDVRICRSEGTPSSCSRKRQR